MFETAGRNGCIRAISRDTRISQNQSGLRRVAAASRAGSGTLCWLGAATGVSDTGAPQPSMSVGGWLTENHQRPVAARETAQQRHCSRIAPDCSPGRSRNRIGQGGTGPGLGHLSAQFRAAAAADLRHTHSVNREEGAAATWRESTSRACTRRLGGEADSPVLSTEMAGTPPP